VKAEYQSGERLPKQFTSIPFIGNLRQITPLSTTYRSSVSEVVDLQNAFKTTSQVEEVQTSSSVDLNNTTENILGTFAETSNTIINTFKNSQATNTGRSRIILVGNQEKKNRYEQQLPQARVVIVPESAGIAVDEVYIDLEPKDAPGLDSPEVFNQWMYTATSRTRLFTHVSNFPKATHIVDAKVSQRKQVENLNEQAVAAIGEQLDTLTKITDDVVIKPIPQVIPEKEEVKEQEEEIQVTPEEVPVEPIGGVSPLYEGTHSLMHPTSGVFIDRSEEEGITALAPGEEVFVIKEVSPMRDGTPAERFIILRSVGTSGNLFEKVGVLNRTEVIPFEQNTNLSVRDLQGHELEETMPGVFQVKQGLRSFAKAFVQPNSQDLKYQYDSSKTDDFSSFLNADGQIENFPLLEKFLKQMWGENAEDVIENYGDVLANPSKYLKVMTFSNTKELKKWFPDFRNQREYPRIGPPYLVIHGLRSKKGRAIKNQFINLSPKILDKNSKMMEPLFEFMETLDNFEKQLAASGLPGVYTTLSAGKVIQVAGQSYYPFHAFVVELSKAFVKKTSGDQPSIKLTSSSHLKGILPDLELSQIPEDLLRLAHELDLAVHGPIEGGERRAYKGKAQAVMFEIGGQNLVITAPSGKNFILRDYFGEEKSSDKKGISLLGPIKFVSENRGGQAWNPLIKEKLLDRLEKYKLSLESRSKVGTSRHSFIKTLLEASGDRHLSPITSADLRDIFIDGQDAQGKYSRISEGFGLRTPLPGALNSKNNPQFDGNSFDVLESHWTGITPTKIVLGGQPNMVEAPKQEERAPRVMSDLDKLKKEVVETEVLASQIDKTYSSDVVAAFVKGTGQPDLLAAIQTYRENAKATKLYITKNNNLFKALQQIVGAPETTIDAIEKDLRTSVDVRDIGRNRGNIASRDFMRASILTRLFKARTKEEIFYVADLARKDFYSTSDRAFTKEDFVEELATYLGVFGITEAEALVTFNEIAANYREIAKNNGVEFPDVKANSLEELYDSQELLVSLSSKLRGLLKRDAFFSSESSTQVPVVSELTSESPEVVADTVADIVPIPNGLQSYLENLLQKADSPMEEFQEALEEDLEFKNLLEERNPDDLLTAATELLSEINLERSMVFRTQDVGEPVSIAQAEELTYRLTGGILPKWFRNLFKSKDKNELFRIFEYNKAVNSRGEKVWGLYKNGVLHYATLPTGEIGSRVVRHELFHKIFWEYLTPAEQVQTLNTARGVFGDLSAEQLEERLAENFETFVVTKQPTIFERLWRKLLRLLGFTYNNLNNLEKIFSLIEANAFSSQKVSVGDIERSAINIRAKFDNYSEFNLVKKALLENFADIQKNRPSNKALTFSEILEATTDRLKDIRDGRSNFFPESYTPEQIEYARKALAKVLKDNQLWTSFVETYFGQTQTRGALLKVLTENRLAEIESKREDLESLETALEQGEEDVTAEDVALARAELGALTGETYDSALVDPAVKLTGAVKQKLVSIEYWKDGKKDFADLNRAYSIVLSGVASIPTNSLEDALNAIITNFKDSQSVKAEPNIRQAVSNFMLRTAQNILNKVSDPNTLNNISFRKDAQFKKTYIIYSKDNSSVQNVSYNVANNNPSKYGVKIIATTLDQALTELSNELNISYGSLADIYYLNEDLDFMKTLIASVGSLRKNKPLVLSERFDFGVYKLFSYVVSTGGGKRIHEANIRFALVSYLKSNANAGSKSILEDSLYNEFLAASSGSTKVKKQFLKNFFKAVGINKSVVDSSELSVERAMDRLALSLPSIKEQYQSINAESDVTAEDIINDESSLVDALADVLNSHTLLGETHSFTRGDGKKAYGWIDSSYQTDVLSSIVNAFSGRAHRIFSTFKVNKTSKTLTTSDRFLKDNIFFNGINKLTDFNDHDSIKQKGNEKFARHIRTERLVDFRKRHFVGNFISRMSVSNGKYYQALPIPSNRTVIQNVEVGVLRGADITKALTSILTAQKNRPNPKDHKDLAENKTYNANENWLKWRFAGLSGKVTELTVAQAVQKVQQHVAEEVANLKKDFVGSADVQPNIRIPDRALARVAKQLNLGNFPEWPKQGKLSDEDFRKTQEAYWKSKNEIVEKTLSVFYYNFIINQYSLSQILYGDEVFYPSKEDQTKRIQIVTATGDTLLTDPVYGLPPKSNVLVVEDLKREIPEDLEGVLPESVGEEYDASDAEGFMLPEFYEKIASAYGIDSSTDLVLKPVYFSIENGIPQAIKYSVKVLTDELVERFPHLNSYREAMRNHPGGPIDQMVFASAFKIGAPKKLASLDSETGELAFIPDNGAVMEINNENLRFQLNPSSSVDKDVANPSQLTAMQNTNGRNNAEIFDLHRANSFIIENGLRKFARELRLTRKGTMTSTSEINLRNKLRKTLEGLPGGRDVYEMLSASLKGQKASLSLPLIAERVASSIGSMLSSSSTGFRFSGSKLILQADLGPQEIINTKTGKTEMRNLKWRDENGYCEVILPAEYSAFVNIGDQIGINDGVIGFRIPSTNYHSAVPIKVVGFYPVPEGSKGNVIIAPSLIVYYHGSDYDVDSLFVIKKEQVEEDIDINPFVKQVFPDHVATSKLIYKKGEVLGYKNNEEQSFDGFKFYEFLNESIIEVTKQIEQITATKVNATAAQISAIEAQLTPLNNLFEKLTDWADIAAKNSVVHNLSTNMVDMKNRRDLLTPISFEDVVGLRGKIKEQISENLKDDDFLRKLASSGLIEIKC